MPTFCILTTIFVFSFLPTKSTSFLLARSSFAAHQRDVLFGSKTSFEAAVWERSSVSSKISLIGSWSGSPIGYAIVIAPLISINASISSSLDAYRLAATWSFEMSLLAFSKVLLIVSTMWSRGASPQRRPVGSKFSWYCCPSRIMILFTSGGGASFPSWSSCSSVYPCKLSGLYNPYWTRSSVANRQDTSQYSIISVIDSQ